MKGWAWSLRWARFLASSKLERTSFFHVPNSVCRDLHRTVSPGSDEELKMSNYMNFDRTKKGSGNVAAPVFGGYSLDNIDPDLLAKQVTVKVSFFFHTTDQTRLATR